MMSKKKAEEKTNKLSQAILSTQAAYGTTMSIIGIPLTTLSILGLAGISISLIATLGIVGAFALPALLIGGVIGYSIYRNQVKPEKKMLARIKFLEQEIEQISIEGKIKENSNLNNLITLLKDEKTNIVELEKQLDDDNLLKGQLKNLKAAPDKTTFISGLAKNHGSVNNNEADSDKLNAVFAPVRAGLGSFSTTTGTTITLFTIGVGVAGLFIAGAALPATAIIGLTIATIGAAVIAGFAGAMLARKIFKRNKAKQSKIAALTEKKHSLEKVNTNIDALCNDAKLVANQNKLLLANQKLAVANEKIQVTQTKENKRKMHTELLANKGLFAKPEKVQLESAKAPTSSDCLGQADENNAIPHMAASHSANEMPRAAENHL